MEALRDQVRRWFNVYRGRLRLDDWELVLRFNDDPAWEKFGECDRSVSREQARIIVGLTLPPDQIKGAVVHELLHLTLEPIESLMDDWSERLDEEAKSLFVRQCKCALEKVIYRLERCLADWEVE